MDLDAVFKRSKVKVEAPQKDVKFLEWIAVNAKFLRKSVSCLSIV